MADAIKEKIMLAEKWCEDVANGSLAESSVGNAEIGNEEMYCESGASIAGKNEEVIRLDRELKQAAKAGSAEEAFKNAPLNGCLSVMTMARKSSGFSPIDLEDKEAAAKFLRYSDNLQKAPFFHLKSSDVSHMEHNEKSWDNVIDNILDLYEGISGNDRQAVQKSIGNMAKAAMKQAGTKQTKNLFVQSTIDYSDKIMVYVFWSKIQMTYESGKSTSTQEVVDISKLELQFDKEMWPYYASMVLKYNLSFIEEWLEENSLPKQENVLETVCFCRNLLQ